MAIIPRLRTKTVTVFQCGRSRMDNNPRFNHTMPYTARLHLARLCREGPLKEVLHILLTTHNAPLDSFSYLQLLQTCIANYALSEGKLIHSFINDRGFAFATSPLFQNMLIKMYCKCGSLVDAGKTFDDMTERDIFSWNTIIAAYRRHGCPHEALTLFHQMQPTEVKPDHFTFASILPACAELGAVEEGMNIHQSLLETGFASDVVVGNALLDMYAKCGSIQKAQQLFDKMTQRNVVSWNAMISGYARNGFAGKALETFKQMELAVVKPDSTTFASILPACGKMGALKQGMYIHQSVMESRFLSDVVVANTLIDMYAKCGSIQKAREVFDKMSQRNMVSWTTIIAGYAQTGVLDEALRFFKEMPQRDVVAWTVIIGGYAQNGLVEKALETFKQMQLAGIKPNSTTFASVLPACAKMGALGQGMDIHQSIIEIGVVSDVVIASALVDMYAKCGSIQKARKLFDEIPQRNVFSWTAMIAGYAMHGYGKDALKLFELMKHSWTYPDHVSFVCVLFACSHAGLVDEGCKYFNVMSDYYCIMPTVDHYLCMVDLLSRAGYLVEALNFIIKMPIKPAAVLWTCLLGACRSHKNIGLGAFSATLLFELGSKSAAPYVLLSDIYTEVGRWGDVKNVRRLMKDREIKKIPGCSWIEVRKKVHVFCAGDRSHPQTHEIHTKLDKLSWEMKAAGYLLNSRYLLNDIEEEEKELFLCHHSEKLAIAFGLLYTSPGIIIRVVKNLRVCVDCHTAAKFISKIVAREIVVRDANRFHHFKKGLCSCGDYW